MAMKTLIIYYSLEGNTAYAAEEVSNITGADTLRLVPKKAYADKGFAKFFWGGKSAVMAEKPELEPYEVNLDGYDRLIFGFPVWASTFAPPLRTFITDNMESIKGKTIAAFACQSGNGAQKAFGKLKKILELESLEETMILIDPKAKPSKENTKIIADFCRKLLSAE